MNEVIDRKYNYLSNFFKTAIDENKLFHSLILYGSNSYIHYAMALEIARQLNCLEDKREDCQCQNCRWIRENKHPAVLTISKIDNQPDSSKKVISQEQVSVVLDTLINSSDYHRVFIFCDAEIKQLSDVEKSAYDEFCLTGFNIPQEAVGEKTWYPSGINTGCFSIAAANSMLKSVEEPPNNVTFIFLTNNKDDLLQTIVSRSQVFYAADNKIISYETKFLEAYFAQYPNFSKDKALDFVQMLLNFQSEKEVDINYIIDCMQYYMLCIAKQNIRNKELLNIIFKDMDKLQNSKRMAGSYIKEQTVYEDLAFYLSSRI